MVPPERLPAGHDPVTTARVQPPASERAWFGALVLLVLWLPLPWGSHTAWAADLLAALSLALLCTWLALATLGHARLPERIGRLAWPLVLWLLWIGWIVLQILPLPPEDLATRSPAAHAAHRAVAELAGAEPRWSSSISPSATGDRLLLTLGYFALYWCVVLGAIGSEARIRALLWTVAAAGTIQALYGALMTLSGLEWAFFAPKRWYLDSATGSFVNRNHFAGYLELTAAAALALVLADLKPVRGRRSWRQRLRDLIAFAFSDRARARVALAIMLVGIVLSKSRMGNLAFFAALTVCGIAFIALRQRALAMRAAILFLSLLVVDVWIVSRWFGFEQLVERLETTDLGQEGRLRLLDEIPPVLEAYGDAGSGLGTFALAYAPFRSTQMREHFDHAHNDYVELAVETGITGLVLVLAFAGIHALHALRIVILRRRRLPAAAAFAALMGLTAMGIHATAEFNLQIPANAATLLVLLALVACCTPKRSPRHRAAGATHARDLPPETREPAAADRGT